MTLSHSFSQQRNCISAPKIFFGPGGWGQARTSIWTHLVQSWPTPSLELGPKRELDPKSGKEGPKNENGRCTRNSNRILMKFGYVFRNEKAPLWALQTVFWLLVKYWLKKPFYGILGGERESPLCALGDVFFKNSCSWGKSMNFTTIRTSRPDGDFDFSAFPSFFRFLLNYS